MKVRSILVVAMIPLVLIFSTVVGACTNTTPTPGKPGNGAVVNSDSIVTAKIQGIIKQTGGYQWKADVLIEYTQNVDNLPNPVKDGVGKVVTVMIDEDMTSYKVNDVVLGRIKYVGDVNTPGGIRLYMYNITLEIHP